MPWWPVNATRITSRAGAAAVAVIAAAVSYSHMRDLAAAHGQAPILAAMIPLSVDGLLLVAAVAMADDRKAGKVPRLSARVSFIAGVTVSIAANATAAPPTLLARAISAWPAVALLLVVEMLARTGAPKVAQEAAQQVVRQVATVATPATTPATARKTHPSSAERVAKAHARTPGATHAQLAERLGVSARTVRQHRPKPADTGRVNGNVPDLTEKVPS